MIEISNLTENLIDENFLKKVAKEVLKGEKKEKENLSIALVGPGRTRALNKRYRGKNRTTDVLAFGEGKILNSKFPRRTPPPNWERGLRGRQIPKTLLELGEVVICLKEVKKNAKKFRQSFEKELATCLIHGILHLLGYNHEKDEKKARIMERKQNYYLNLV